MKRPPLLSAVSDPQLVPPTSSVLLTQLLTNSKLNRDYIILSTQRDVMSKINLNPFIFKRHLKFQIQTPTVYSTEINRWV